jgi:hypothetical protein
MSRQPSPLFLERETYRRRRLMDAARILPVLGLVLFLLPALWQRPGAPNTAGEALYLFAVWAMLILAAALLARPLRRTDAPRRPSLPAAAAPEAVSSEAVLSAEPPPPPAAEVSGAQDPPPGRAE